MTASDDAPFILTLALDSKTFSIFDTLRRRYFPPDRNFIPAHVTLFHALPASKDQEIRSALDRIRKEQQKFIITFETVRFLGKGVAVGLNAPDLLALRQKLSVEFWEWLTVQDKQKYRPHITVQNKVRPESAKTLYDSLRQSWEPVIGTADGLLLWRYRGGPWELVEHYEFFAP